MRISQATADDVAGLARLVWLNHLGAEPSSKSLDEFATELAGWWAARQDAHVAFVARVAQPEIVGMAWAALVPRVPRPGTTGRLSADLQSVFVLPQHRGNGVGSALVDAVTEHATRLGALHTTVHSGQRAVPLYERLGFEASRQLLQRYPD